jgi:hypothetical protein
MDNIQEYSKTLAHYGRPGMKWGRRKGNSLSPSRIGAVNAQRRIEGQAAIAKAGSAGKATARIAARRVAVAAVVVIAKKAIKQIPDENVRAGANAIVNLGNTAMLAVDINSAIKIGQGNAANNAANKAA